MYAESSLPFEATWSPGRPGCGDGPGQGRRQRRRRDDRRDDDEHHGARRDGPLRRERAGRPATGSLAQYTLVWSTDGSFDADHVLVRSLWSSRPPRALSAPDTRLRSPLRWGSARPGSRGTTSGVLRFGRLGGWLFHRSPGRLGGRGLAASLRALRAALGGLCSREGVRPCHGDCACNFQVLSRGHIVGDHSNCSGSGIPAGATDLSRVKLAGYVRQVTEVKIDGVVLDPSEYRVDEHKWLTRKNGGSLALALPRRSRRHRGRDLRRLLHLREDAAAGGDRGRQAARLSGLRLVLESRRQRRVRHPRSATRVTRQGITVERSLFQRNRDTGRLGDGARRGGLLPEQRQPQGTDAEGLFFGPGSRGRFAKARRVSRTRSLRGGHQPPAVGNPHGPVSKYIDSPARARSEPRRREHPALRRSSARVTSLRRCGRSPLGDRGGYHVLWARMRSSTTESPRPFPYARALETGMDPSPAVRCATSTGPSRDMVPGRPAGGLRRRTYEWPTSEQLHAIAVASCSASAEALDSVNAYDATLLGAQERRFVCPGTPVLDCCDQLTVHVSAIAQAGTTPGGLAAGKRHLTGTVNHPSFQITSTRCIPVGSETSTGGFIPPTPTALQEAARQLDCRCLGALEPPLLAAGVRHAA